MLSNLVSNQPNPNDESKGFLEELSRRRVFRVAGTYILVAWVLMQAGEIVFPAFDLPNRALRLLILSLVAGFPIVVLLAWIVDVTPDGIRLTRTSSSERETPETKEQAGRGLEIALLGFAIPLFASAILLILLTLQNASDESVSPGQPTAIRAGVAVLRFEDLSPTIDRHDFFARGMHEELLTHLARVPGLRLISRNSLDQTAGDEPAEIARRLGVEHILMGSIRRTPTRVRVSARLIETRSGEHAWVESFDAELSEVLTLQSQLAQRIVRTVASELDPGPPASPAEGRIRSFPALDAYLKARDLHRDAAASDEDARHRAQAFYEEALRLDDAMARAWLHLGILHAEFYWFGYDRSAARAARVRGCLDQARTRGISSDRLALGEGIAAYYVDEDYGRALLLFDQVAQSAPGDADAHFYRAMVLRRSGALKQALEAQQRTRVLDPLNLGYEDELALTLSLAGRLEEAKELLDSIVTRDPDRESARLRSWNLELELDGNPSSLLDTVLGSEMGALTEPRQALVTVLAILAGRAEDGIMMLERYKPLRPDGGAHLERMAALTASAGHRIRSVEFAQAARESLNRAMQVDADLASSVSARQLGAWIDFRRGKESDALAAQAALVSENPIESDLITGAPLLWDLMMMQLEADEPEDAAGSLRRLAARVAPGSIPNGGFFLLENWPSIAEGVRHPDFEPVLSRHRPRYSTRWSRAAKQSGRD